MLASAFAEFVTASAKLELSYRDLQAEVAELTSTLSQRDSQLLESLSEAERLGFTLQHIVQAMPCGVLVTDGDGEVLLANPEAARLLSLSAAEMPTLLAIHGKTGLNLQAITCGGAEDASEQELSFESHSGRRWIAVRRVQLPRVANSAEQRSFAEAVLTLQDISTRKRLEQEREAAREAVALAQISAVLAHEIRNPLASLELFAGLIADDPERRAEWLSHLHVGIRSLSGTVNNVLAWHGGALPTTERLNVAAEAAFAVDFLQPLARRDGISLRWQTHAGTDWILANKSAFHQILINLCSNALRHTPAGGDVLVHCEEDPQRQSILIAVTDTGCGISAKHLPRVFEAGFSATGTTPGLGLAVCQRLVRQHGGTISVVSTMGHGSTFTLEFQQA